MKHMDNGSPFGYARSMAMTDMRVLTLMAGMLLGPAVAPAGSFADIVADPPAYVDELAGDYRLSPRSPFIDVQGTYHDVGAEPADLVIELAEILDARIVLNGCDTIETQGGVLERSTLDSGALSMAPRPDAGMPRMFELRVHPNCIDWTVTIEARDNGAETAFEPSEGTVVWRASYNWVEAGRLTLAELPASGWSAPRPLSIDNEAPGPVRLRMRQTGRGVMLSWEECDSLSDVVRCKVYRVPCDSAWSARQIASLPRDVNSYLDTGAHLRDARYEVVAYDSTGNQSLPVYEIRWAHRGIVPPSIPPAKPAPGDTCTAFPLLVRLRRGTFDFSEARGNGEDIRFADRRGRPLPFEIEHWDSAGGEAALWVLVDPSTVCPPPRPPRRCVVMYWGNPTVGDRSCGARVFDTRKGYEAVWHLGPRLGDATGGRHAVDSGTHDADGIICRCRQFPGGATVLGGELDLSGTKLTLSAWVRAERWSSDDVSFVSQGHGAGREPAFSLGLSNGMLCATVTTVNGTAGVCARRTKLPPRTWLHAAATYDGSMVRLYLDGREIGRMALTGDIVHDSGAITLLGGGGFEGMLDEVRIERTVRSPAWLWLCAHSQQRGPWAVVHEIPRHGPQGGQCGGQWGPDGPCGDAALD